MVIGSKLQEYIHAFGMARSLAELCALIQEVTLHLGYNCFTLTQHVDLSGSLKKVVILSTYDMDWIKRFITRRYFRFDPVHAASHHFGVPFAWDQISDFIPLTRRQHALFREARRFGIVDGLTVPLHRPGERPASCTFVSDRRRSVTMDQRVMAHAVATFAYQAALDLVRGRRSRPRVPRLTDRQIDCLLLSAAGKTEWETARILGISLSTVHSHMMQAMRRYGVFNRQQLLFHALRDGLISFADLGFI